MSYSATVARTPVKEFQISARVTQDARQILEAATRRFGVSQASVIEMALRLYADKNQIAYGTEPTETP